MVPIVNNKSEKRTDPDRTDWFTIRENEFLELLKRFQIVKVVATEMSISYRRAEEILSNIRRKWRWSVNTHNKILAMSSRDMPFRKLLCTPARRAPSPIEEVVEEEFEEE